MRPLLLSRSSRFTAVHWRPGVPVVTSPAYLFSSAVACAVLSVHARTASALSTMALPSVGEISFHLNNASLLSATTINSGEKTFGVVNPGSKDGKEVIAKCRVMDRSDAKIIIEASAAALPAWRDGTTCLHRSKILTKWSDEIKDNMEDMATIMTMESGKPLAESKGEVMYACSFLDYYAGEALRPTSAGGGFIAPSTFSTPEGTPRGQIIAINEAVGVAAMVTPWNFPAAMITRKVGPALAAGCTAVVKPSELTPLSAIALCALGKKAGIPDGVFELVVAGTDSTPAVGEEFCSNPIVKKISFTGSVAVGKLLARQSADTVKKVSLELGGNAPFIVFDDADVDVAVQAAIASKFRHAGQTCVCSDRFLVHRSIHDEFVSKFVAAVEQLKVAPGMNEGATMGPLIASNAAESVRAKVEEAIAISPSTSTTSALATEVAIARGVTLTVATVVVGVAVAAVVAVAREVEADLRLAVEHGTQERRAGVSIAATVARKRLRDLHSATRILSSLVTRLPPRGALPPRLVPVMLLLVRQPTLTRRQSLQPVCRQLRCASSTKMPWRPRSRQRPKPRPRRMPSICSICAIRVMKGEMTRSRSRRLLPPGRAPEPTTTATRLRMLTV